MPFSVIMGKVLGVRVVRTIHDAHTDAYLELGFVLVLVLDLVLSESLPAVGYALLTSCSSALSRSGCSFLPVVGPLFSPAGGSCWCCCGLLFVLDCPGLCPLHVRDPRVRSPHVLSTCAMRGLGYVKDLAVHVLTHASITARSLTCCGWSGRPQPHSEEETPPLQALRVEMNDPRARLATLSLAWSWIPPCHVWSTIARRWRRLVSGVFASKVGFALLGFPRSCTRLLWIVVFPLRPPRCSPAETLLESAYDTRSRSWLCLVVIGHLSTQTCSN